MQKHGADGLSRLSVGHLPGGPPRQMLKEGVEQIKGPGVLSLKKGLYLDKLFAGVSDFLYSYATARGPGLPN